MEKLEQEMNAPEKMAETPSPKKTAGKKKKFRKNQVIITALAIMIAVAGYINYADSTLSTKEKADGTTADASTVLKDISSLDTDITDEVDAGTAGDSSRTVTETPGEAVLAGASTYMAQARIDREQIRSQNKDTLNEIINNTNLSETERQSAVQSMVEMTELVEKESATELLLEAKGFTDVVVNLTGETADIVVPMKEVTEEQRAQIEDIVTRKTGIGVENIVITPMSSAADTAAEERCSVNFDIHVKKSGNAKSCVPGFFHVILFNLHHVLFLQPSAVLSSPAAARSESPSAHLQPADSCSCK